MLPISRTLGITWLALADRLFEPDDLLDLFWWLSLAGFAFGWGVRLAILFCIVLVVIALVVATNGVATRVAVEKKTNRL